MVVSEASIAAVILCRSTELDTQHDILQPRYSSLCRGRSCFASVVPAHSWSAFHARFAQLVLRDSLHEASKKGIRSILYTRPHDSGMRTKPKAFNILSIWPPFCPLTGEGPGSASVNDWLYNPLRKNERPNAGSAVYVRPQALINLHSSSWSSQQQTSATNLGNDAPECLAPECLVDLYHFHWTLRQAQQDCNFFFWLAGTSPPALQLICDLNWLIEIDVVV